MRSRKTWGESTAGCCEQSMVTTRVCAGHPFRRQIRPGRWPPAALHIYCGHTSGPNGVRGWVFSLDQEMGNLTGTEMFQEPLSELNLQATDS